MAQSQKVSFNPGYKKPSFFKLVAQNKTLLLMCLPAVVFFFIFSYMPMPGAYIAFTNFQYNKGIWASPFVGLQNFKFLFTSGQLTLLLVGFSLMISVLFMLFRDELLVLLFGQIEPQVMAYARTYFTVSIISYPFLALYNVGASVFRAVGNSKLSMTVSTAANALNLIGNAILIYGFGLEVLGAGLATLASRILGAVIMLYKLLRPDCRVGMRSFGDLRFQREMFGRILRIGIPSGLESAAFNIGKLLVASLVSTLVTAAITANAVMNTLQSIILIPTSAIHLAAVPIVGQCLGAGKAEDAKYYTKWLVGLAYICLFITAGGTLLFADPILSLFKLTPETTAVALRLLRFYFCIVVTLYPLAFTITPCLRAAGDVRFCLIGAMTGMWLGRILCSHLFVSFGWGIMGVWVAIVADWLIRIAFYLPRYLSGRWLKKKVI